MKHLIFAVAAILCLSLTPAKADEHHQGHAAHPSENHQAANQMCFPSVSTGSVDEDFMRNMIPHHEMAVEMAQEELKGGTDPEARKLAESIIAAQLQQIEMMKKWVALRDKAGKK